MAREQNFGTDIGMELKDVILKDDEIGFSFRAQFNLHSVYLKLFALDALKRTAATLVSLRVVVNLQVSTKSTPVVRRIRTLFALEFFGYIGVVEHVRATGDHRRENIITNDALEFVQHFVHGLDVVPQILFVEK